MLHCHLVMLDMQIPTKEALAPKNYAINMMTQKLMINNSEKLQRSIKNFYIKGIPKLTLK